MNPAEEVRQRIKKVEADVCVSHKDLKTNLFLCCLQVGAWDLLSNCFLG